MKRLPKIDMSPEDRKRLEEFAFGETAEELIDQERLFRICLTADRQSKKFKRAKAQLEAYRKRFLGRVSEHLQNHPEEVAQLQVDLLRLLQPKGSVQ